MPDMAAIISDGQRLVLSGLPPSPRQRRLAIAVALGMFAVFVVVTVGALSGIRTTRIESFLPAYLTAMFVCDSITAVLLFAQYSMLRQRATLVIASGYLFAAIVLIPYAATFPGATAASPVVGSLQSAACLYVFWHGGFPLFVIAYAMLKARPASPRARETAPRVAISRSVVLTLCLVTVGAIPCLVGGDALPGIMLDSGHFGPLWVYLVGLPVGALSVTAIVVLWKRQGSMLDLWLTVVMFVYVREMPVSYYPDPSRFSAGWYVARLFGFLGSSLVLVVLLYEIDSI